MFDTLHLRASGLPDRSQESVDFLESSFFKNDEQQPQLPTPDAVKAQIPLPRSALGRAIVRYDELNLLVKYGQSVSVEEALTLWTIRKVFGDAVPVPELYGWRIKGSCVFIYMQLMDGVPAAERWDTLSDEDKTSVCEQLHGIVSALRQVKQAPDDPFIGTVSRQCPEDVVFEKPNHKPPAHFNSCKQFNDWLSSLPWLTLTLPKGFQDPWREFLPDDASITLTHGDLHRSNIMVSSTGPPKVLAIIDWAYAGWYPDFWEYCKAAYTSDCYGEWRNVWMPKFLTPCDDTLYYWSEYIMAMGAI